MSTSLRIAVLGASGYTGSELVRLLMRHPNAKIVALSAESKAGKTMAEVFPQFAPFDLPRLVKIERSTSTLSTSCSARCRTPRPSSCSRTC